MSASRLKHKQDRSKKLCNEDDDTATNSDSNNRSGHAQAGEQKKVRWKQSASIPKVSIETDSEDLTTSEKTCLAAWCKHGHIGCAYYDPLKCVLYVLEDTEESRHFDLTHMLIEQSNPDVVLTSSKADDEFMDILREHSKSDPLDVVSGFFQIRPHKDFVPCKGRERLLSLPFLSDLSQPKTLPPSDPGVNSRNAYDFMRAKGGPTGDPMIKRWNASIRLSNFTSTESSPLCMASIGALIDHLIRERAIDDCDDNGINGLAIHDIEIIALDQVMHINADALFSLQVFENESHASVYSNKTKEGLSLFGTLNRTKTSLGRSLLRTWLLRPSLSLSVINSRHDAVACFSSAENLVAANTMHSHLKGIKNMPRILGIIRGGNAKTSDWQDLVKFTFHSAMLRDTLTELRQASDIEVVKELISALDVASFKELGRRIDWEESTNAGRVCVRRHIDEELDNRKHVYQGIDTVLSKVAEQICERVPHSYATSLNVVYFPQLGFLICVPMLEEWQTETGIQTIDEWKFQFSSNAHVYFKSQEMWDMDTHIGDLHSSIVDREIEIIQGLIEEIVAYDKAMAHACQVCAELDCLLSFAEASRMNAYNRPQMVEDNIMDIHQSRHPLQEQIVDMFVPNDVFIVGGAGTSSLLHNPEDPEQNSVLLCTGANACGKSVYLKQIALIQYMAQIGCFVPAESAILGIVDKIFTRISTRESVSRVQSAFMIDLNQVSLALRNSTSRSLVLLDEFGKGTISTDGGGLFCGVLRHFLERGPDCPKVLATTHFHDVFRGDIFDSETLPISFRYMEVLFTTADGSILDSNHSTQITEYDMASQTEGDRGRDVRIGDKVTYLYKVAKGLSLDSHAAKCAEIYGIPSRLVTRAQYVSHLISTHELGRLLDEDMTEKERLDLQDAESVCRRFLAWNLDATDQDMNIKTKLAECLGIGV